MEISFHRKDIPTMRMLKFFYTHDNDNDDDENDDADDEDTSAKLKRSI